MDPDPHKHMPIPPRAFDSATCTVLVDHPRLLVLGTGPDQVLPMRLYPVDAQDDEDMITF